MNSTKIPAGVSYLPGALLALVATLAIIFLAGVDDALDRNEHLYHIAHIRQFCNKYNITQSNCQAAIDSAAE